ncbi:MAG: membrane protein insertase YidC [Endomicrobia bacterium]|nr:membrane protein insertase YidC [Endomicrobiia bacterium]MCL2799825.1 membrane protein insertase YidC [Endomicrobiia bacterium]
MNKNSVLFVLFSAITLFGYYYFFPPQQPNQTQTGQNQAVQTQQDQSKAESVTQSPEESSVQIKEADGSFISEETIEIETDKYRALFSNRGASVINWSIKEKSGNWVDLVLPGAAPMMANFPGSNYKIVSKSNEKIVFEHVSAQGWKIIKTYSLSQNSYMHNLNIKLSKTKDIAQLPGIQLDWGPGLGTDEKEMKENASVTRVIAFTASKPGKLKKLKKESELASLFRWAAIDNRYFLVAFIPERSIDFDQIIPSRQDKKHPFSLTLTANPPKDVESKEYSADFYIGPKWYTYLKTFNLGLEASVDFSVFGFLGKWALSILTYFHKITNNYGWAIIMLTLVIQIIVLPLTLKSLKSAAAMKRIQPMIKEIQDKFKNDPKRLQAEMLNVYKTQKVNPLGGCLPMLLQLPIFWAFFSMLRNSYELRNEGWILWVTDLSAPDRFMNLGMINLNLLPLIMGIGMFFQQKMTAVTSDPMQRRLMYMMPVIFTFMFWTFPSGLVLYWLTNSVCSMILQYYIMKRTTTTIKN